MCRDFARSYALGRVAASTRKTYTGAWNMWIKWRERVHKSPWIAKGSEEGEIVEELAEYMAYCSANLGNMDSTIMGKLVAVNFDHQQSSTTCLCR